VVSMSLSLVAVFIPFMFAGGIVGRIFKEFTVTLHNMRGQWHDRDHAFLLCAKITGQAQRARGKHKKTYKTCYTRICHDSVSRKRIF